MLCQEGRSEGGGLKYFFHIEKRHIKQRRLIKIRYIKELKVNPLGMSMSIPVLMYVNDYILYLLILITIYLFTFLYLQSDWVIYLYYDSIIQCYFPTYKFWRNC